MNAYVKPTTAHPCLPPAVGIPRQGRGKPANRARRDGHPLAHLMRLRDEAAAEIERLLAFLDATEGHADDEDEGSDEPSLGSTVDYNGNGAFYLSAPSAEPDLEGPDVDLEPSLCGITVELRGNDQDLEDEHDGKEPDDSGIADLDGYMEQAASYKDHWHGRVMA